METTKLYVEMPVFTGRNVPITEIAKAIGKDAQYIRVGLQKGILKFGYALKLEDSSEFNTTAPTEKFGKKQGISMTGRRKYHEKSPYRRR